MSETWRLLLREDIPADEINGPDEAAFQMALDEAIVENYEEGKAPPTLRLYTWRAPAMTVGYFQSIEDLDREACRSAKIPVIRRITGGRAVLHGRDLTYSLIAGPDSSIFSSASGYSRHGVRESFFTISRAFISALNRLGLEAEAVGVPCPRLPDGQVPAGTASRGDKSPLCFASSSWYEIASRGCKVIGSAQRRWKDRFLQQGSILLEFDPGASYQLFRFSDPERRLEMIRAAGQSVAGLNDHAGRAISYDEAVAALEHGFGEALGIVLKKEALTADEIERARRLAFKKYATEAWNRFRTLS